MALVHGVKGVGSGAGYATQPSWVTTTDVSSRDRLLLAAPADTGTGLPITVQEAAILGWVAGDGHVETGRKTPTWSIAQSKPVYVDALRRLLADVPHAEYQQAGRKRNGDPAGPRFQFRLGHAWVADLRARVGHPKHDAVRQVLAMSAEQREAWLAAIIDAEGHREMRPGYTEPKVMICQTLGPVHDAIVLAVYLSGRRPRVSPHTRGHETWTDSDMIRLNNPIITGEFLTKENAGRGPVWCVTTELGSWTAEEDGHVFLTGNSDINWQRGTPSVGLMQVIGPTYSRYHHPSYNRGPFAYGVSEDGLSNILASIRYALATYGSLARAYLRKGGYDLGGWLQPGLTLAANATGQPEAVLTASQWDTLSQVVAGAAGSTVREDHTSTTGAQTNITIPVQALPGMDTRQLAREVAVELAWQLRPGAA